MMSCGADEAARGDGGGRGRGQPNGGGRLDEDTRMHTPEMVKNRASSFVVQERLRIENLMQ